MYARFKLKPNFSLSAFKELFFKYKKPYIEEYEELFDKCQTVDERDTLMETLELPDRFTISFENGRETETYHVHPRYLKIITLTGNVHIITEKYYVYYGSRYALWTLGVWDHADSDPKTKMYLLENVKYLEFLQTHNLKKAFETWIISAFYHPLKTKVEFFPPNRFFETEEEDFQEAVETFLEKMRKKEEELFE